MQRASPAARTLETLLDAVPPIPTLPRPQVEAQFLSYLSLLFLIILLEGIAVGGSGFLSEEGDKFVLVRARVDAAPLPATVAAAPRGARGESDAGRLPTHEQDYIYPAFTPSIGFFLLCSSVYGASPLAVAFCRQPAARATHADTRGPGATGVWKAGLLGGNQEQPKK